jgi:DNA-binding CsgD family transcriptional regulator
MAEVGQIASGPGRVADRVDALLESLHRLVPFRAAGIFLLDPRRRRQVPVFSTGYDDAVSSYITSPANSDEIELLGFNRVRSALRVQDLPVALERVPGWAQYLWPAGFRGGLAVGLFTPDGRHLGILGMNTETDRHPTAAARDLIGALAPVIADTVDPLRSASRLAAMVGGAQAGVVLTRTGEPLALPGLSEHPLLAEGSAVVAVAAGRLSTVGVYSSFLARYVVAGAPDSLVRITVLACPPAPVHDLVAVVLLSPPGDVRGLTARELEVLGLLVEGASNHRIAAALFITRRTVNAHLEHILAKLGTPTRTQAAVHALRLGLYVPRQLHRGGPA